jgi:Flp pilus assembly protein protease CpaA
MLDIVLIAIGLAGFSATAWLDIKTTEFPDWIPYLMIAATIAIRLIFNLEIFYPFLSGVIFLAFGFALYLLKQWGDGDMWLFCALGFLYPTEIIRILLIFFITAFIYLVLYSLVLGFKNPKVFSKFWAELKRDAKGSIVIGFALAVFAVTAFIWYNLSILFSLLFIVLFIALLLFYRYGRIVEQLLKKRIDAAKIKPSDVPLDSKWRNLTKEEIEKIKKKGGKVWIKEGARFAPVFLISFVICLIF